MPPWDDDKQDKLEDALSGALGVTRGLGVAVGIGKLGQIARAGRAIAEHLMDERDPAQRIAGSLLHSIVGGVEDELATFAAEHAADMVADRLEDYTVRNAARDRPSAAERVRTAEAERDERTHRRAQARPGGRVIDAEFVVYPDEAPPPRARPRRPERAAEEAARAAAARGASPAGQRAAARRAAAAARGGYSSELGGLLPAPKKRR